MQSGLNPRHATCAWLVLAGLLGSLQAFHFRNSMNPDGIAYLDMGDAYVRGDWATAVRSHWSPLYAWLLALVLRFAQPPPSLELPLVHLVNLFIYCLALGAFTFLMREVLAIIRTSAGPLESTWISLGYAIFVWCTLHYTPLSLVTPDLLVSAFVYASCGVILRMRRQPSGRRSALLGVLLGLGYLAKAPMLPLSVVFLAASALVVNDQARRIAHLAVATITLALVAVPFILVLSAANGRPTVGDSATLNYLWRIDGAPLVHWQGGPDGIGQPIHQSELLLERPPIFGFDSPFRVTYSAWYAPEYWFKGATPVFMLSGQVRALVDALLVYAGLAVDQSVLLVGLAILLAMHAGPRSLGGGPWLVLIAPAVAAFAMYAVVLAEGRYVAPFMVLLTLGLLTLVRLPKGRSSAALAGPLSMVLVVVLLLQIGWTTAGLVRSMLSQGVHGQFLAPDDHVQVAGALRSAGIRPGDPVASGNRGFNDYWARLARVVIVAEVSGRDGTAILEAEPEARTAAQRVLLAQNVRAVVAYRWPARTGDSGWHPIEGTDYFYYLVPARS